MADGIEKTVFYFHEKGAENTDHTLDVAIDACEDRQIEKIVIASSTGNTALRLHEKAGPSLQIIAVTYGAGSRFKEEVEAFGRNRDALQQKGIGIVQGLHGLSGAERAFENRYSTRLMPLNIVADSLRMFSHGVKVCVEIAVMAAEHGFVTPPEEIIGVAGSGHGADTALVLRSAYAARLFETKIRAVLCMPA